MLSQQEISDRFEIQDLVFHYADLIDRKQIQRLRDEVFTEDVHVDYSAMGGSVGGLDETIDFLESVLTNELLPNSQHLNANVQVTVDGDRASGQVMCFNPMGIAQPGGAPHMMFLGLYYLDKYQRTADGWRIAERVEERSWGYNVPEGIDAG